MRTFAAVLALMFAIPLSVLIVGGARTYSFWRRSLASEGSVLAVQERDWIDDEAQPVKRYFAIVRYVVAGEEHTISHWGPHMEAPVVGSTVAIRYRLGEPSVAQVWSELGWFQLGWLLVAFFICVAAEVWALRTALIWPY
jgi:hypothetical protein